MSSRYTPARAIPPSFPDVLRDFSREVLRNYPRGRNAPADGTQFILDFAARYFANGGKPPVALKTRKLDPKSVGSNTSRSTEAAGAAGAGLSSAAAAGVAALDRLESRIVEIFRGADRDGSGKLDSREIRAVLRTLAEEVGLQLTDVRLLTSLADTDNDGLISYPEFIPLAVQIVSLIAAKQKEAADRGAVKAAALQGAEYALVHGFSQPELQSRLLDAFRLVDADNDGFISFQELSAALHGSGLGLSRKDMNLIMQEAAEYDVDGNGKLSFAEFAPVVFSLLAENIAKQMEIELTPSEVASIAALLARECEAYDPSRSGRIPLTAVTAVLRDSDLHLSWMQQQAVAAQVPVDADGMVDVSAFAERAAGLMHALQRAQVDASFAGRLIEMRSSPVVVVNNGAATVDRPTFDNALLALLSALDKGDGKAPVSEFRSALAGTAEGSPFQLAERQVEALVAAGLSTSDDEAAQAVDAAASGSAAPIALQTVLQVGFDVLHHLQELELLAEYAAAGGAGAGGR